MQVSKIAVSNQFSVNRNQKVNANNNNPNFGWVIVGTVNKSCRKGLVNSQLLRLRTLLDEHFAQHIAPTKIISEIDDITDGGRVLVDVDIPETNLRGCLNSLLGKIVKQFDITVLGKNIDECRGKALADLKDSELKLAA